MNDAVVAKPQLAHVGETFSKTLKFSRAEITAFAQLSGDSNPLHRDVQAAQRARYGEIIASGQHSVAMLMGILASHFSRRDDGVWREMVCINTNFAFKEPVFADQELVFQWKVTSTDWKPRSRSMLVQLDGSARVARGKPVVVARATILVREAKG